MSKGRPTVNDRLLRILLACAVALVGLGMLLSLVVRA